jgi:hypothetical protein
MELVIHEREKKKNILLYDGAKDALNPDPSSTACLCAWYTKCTRGLISLWLYKEENKLRDGKNMFTYSPLSATYLLLLFINLYFLTANGFIPDGSRTTIRHNTQTTHITQNNTTIKRNTVHKTTHTQ